MRPKNIPITGPESAWAASCAARSSISGPPAAASVDLYDLCPGLPPWQRCFGNDARRVQSAPAGSAPRPASHRTPKAKRPALSAQLWHPAPAKITDEIRVGATRLTPTRVGLAPANGSYVGRRKTLRMPRWNNREAHPSPIPVFKLL